MLPSLRASMDAGHVTMPGFTPPHLSDHSNCGIHLRLRSPTLSPLRTHKRPSSSSLDGDHTPAKFRFYSHSAIVEKNFRRQTSSDGSEMQLKNETHLYPTSVLFAVRELRENILRHVQDLKSIHNLQAVCKEFQKLCWKNLHTLSFERKRTEDSCQAAMELQHRDSAVPFTSCVDCEIQFCGVRTGFPLLKDELIPRIWKRAPNLDTLIISYPLPWITSQLSSSVKKLRVRHRPKIGTLNLISENNQGCVMCSPSRYAKMLQLFSSTLRSLAVDAYTGSRAVDLWKAIKKCPGLEEILFINPMKNFGWEMHGEFFSIFAQVPLRRLEIGSREHGGNQAQTPVNAGRALKSFELMRIMQLLSRKWKNRPAKAETMESFFLKLDSLEMLSHFWERDVLSSLYPTMDLELPFVTKLEVGVRKHSFLRNHKNHFLPLFQWFPNLKDCVFRFEVPAPRSDQPNRLTIDDLPENRSDLSLPVLISDFMSVFAEKSGSRRLNIIDGLYPARFAETPTEDLIGHQVLAMRDYAPISLNVTQRIELDRKMSSRFVLVKSLQCGIGNAFVDCQFMFLA